MFPAHTEPDRLLLLLNEDAARSLSRISLLRPSGTGGKNSPGSRIRAELALEDGRQCLPQAGSARRGVSSPIIRIERHQILWA